ncbi:MAG TPA: hypothetical protein ENF93_01875 [Ignisphaera sp.]|nr:hypothetical protein [Ignisphaera sp.]
MSKVLGVLGKIYTSFNPVKKVNGVLIVNGIVVYTGSSSVIEKICKDLPCTLRDLGENVAIPGFIDAHLHLDGLGLSLNTLDLRGVRSIEELKKRLRDFAKERKGWIIGRGWDQELFIEKRWPTRWDLDSVVSDRPVLLVRVCGHAGVVNSKVIEMLKLEDKFRDNPNLDRSNGMVTGIVKEEVLSYIRNSIEFSEKELKKHLLDAQKHLLQQGVTSIGFVSVSMKILPVIFELRY